MSRTKENLRYYVKVYALDEESIEPVEEIMAKRIKPSQYALIRAVVRGVV